MAHTAGGGPSAPGAARRPSAAPTGPRRPVFASPAARVVALAGVLAAGWLGVVWVPAPVPPPGMVRVPWWLLAVLFVATDALVFRVRIRREQWSVAISELPLVIGLFTLAPTALLMSRVIGGGIAFVVFRRTTVLKTSFNLALVGFGTVVAAATFHLVVGGATAGSLRGWLAALLAAVATTTVDGLALTLVVSWYDGWPSRRVLLEQFGHAIALPVSAATVGVVASIALMGGRRAALPLVLACVVVLLGYRAYALLAERHAAVSRLFGLSDALSRAESVDQVARAAVGHAADVLRARSAELLLHSRGAPRLTLWRTGHGEGVAMDEAVPWPHPAFDVRPRHVVRGATDAERALLSVLRQQEAIVVPLPLGDDLDGVLVVGERRGEEPGYLPEDVHTLDTVGNHVDVALRHAWAAQRLHFEALHDHLTGLPNRGIFRRRADEAAASALSGGPPIAVGVLDLDGFKTVNDSLGHQVGDQVIAEVAHRLERAAGPQVGLGRLGGDEFAVLIYDATDLGRVTEVAQRIITSLGDPLVIGGEHLRLGGSLGLAVGPRDGGNADALLRSADVAMYSAKQDSGGYRFYAREMAVANDAPLTLAADLRLGLGRGEISVLFQPLVRLDTGRLHSVEALARWRHPTFGHVDPETFVVAAERGGLVQELTGVVLDKALAACRAWLDQGVEVKVAVNLAARTMGDEWLPNTVGRLLERYGVPGRLLCLEITEGGVIASPERALAVATQLRELGVSVAVDDFGTGYSSMTYLSWLSPDQVKIDKSFVMRLGAGSPHEAIIRSILDLGKNLAVEVVAEGVSDAPTAAMLRHLGCRLAQGYYFAEPMPGGELLDWAGNWASRSWIGDSVTLDARTPRRRKGDGSDAPRRDRRRAHDGGTPDGHSADGTAADGTAGDGTAGDGTAGGGHAPGRHAPDGGGDEGTGPYLSVVH